MTAAASTASAAPAAEKLDFKKLLPVFVIVLIDLLGMTIIIPLLPLYATSFGANALTIGLLGLVIESPGRTCHARTGWARFFTTCSPWSSNAALILPRTAV